MQSMQIDCDAPHPPLRNWPFVRHQPRGKFLFDPKRIELVPVQADEYRGKLFDYRLLLAPFAQMPVMNANVLLFLLTHQDRVDARFKERPTVFVGTEFSRPDKDCSASYLYHENGIYHRGMLITGGVFMLGTFNVAVHRP